MKSTLTLVTCLASVLTINAAANLNTNTDILTNTNANNTTIVNDDIVNTSTLSDDDAQRLLKLDEEAQHEMEDFDITTDALANDIINYASSFRGTPYKWGATGPKSFDCSGFTGYVYKNFGIQLNRTSRHQYLQGQKVSRNELQPGDLVFFAGRNGGNTVRHVGMVSEVKDNGKVQFIHSSTKKGVTHSFLDENYYNKRYLGARRILNS